MSKKMSVTSTETIPIPITALNIANGEAKDPTGLPVFFAFKADGVDPQDADAQTGQWETWDPIAGTGQPQFMATCLVGPKNGGVLLAVGRYVVWVKVTDNPDVPWLRADVLVIT